MILELQCKRKNLFYKAGRSIKNTSCKYKANFLFTTSIKIYSFEIVNPATYNQLISILFINQSVYKETRTTFFYKMSFHIYICYKWLQVTRVDRFHLI